MKKHETYPRGEFEAKALLDIILRLTPESQMMFSLSTEDKDEDKTIVLNKETKLKLVPYEFSPEYTKHWNIIQHDFVRLYKDNELISDAAWRIGGFGATPNGKYFALIKHTEDYYEDNITKDPKEKPHLKSNWCIIDKNGVEKIVCKKFDSPYIIGDILCSIDQVIYDIESGYSYGKSYHNMITSEFVFIHIEYDEDKSKRGVYKINRTDGTFEFFK